MTNKESGPVGRSAGYYGEIVSGTLDIADIAGVQLNSVSTSVFEILVQNDPASTSTIAIGNVTGQHVKITAGNHITVPIENLNLVYVNVPDGGTATVNYFAPGHFLR